MTIGMARVLIIDDVEVARTVYSAALRKAGHDVETAENGGQATQLVNQSKFDVILTDLVMPEVDGLELIQMLMKIQDRPAVIAMSADEEINQSVYLKAAEMMGADHVVSKPINFDHLNRLVADLSPGPTVAESQSHQA